MHLRSNEVTFVMYNATEISSLKFFQWNIELSQSASAISMPANYSHKRMWFTAYDSKR